MERITVGLATAALLFFLIMVLVPGTAISLSPTIKNLAAPEVKQMIESSNTVIIHVLSELEFKFQHIPGSINIPITQMKTSSALPAEFDRPLIFYCMGAR